MKSKTSVDRYNFNNHFKPQELEDLSKEFLNILTNGTYILSDSVKEFEQEFSQFHNINYCVGCNSGTDALILALMALKIGLGDEVIVPANTFHATVLAVSRVGAKPILVDVNSDSFLMTGQSIENAITSKTKAVLIVHLYGASCEMESILQLCNKKNIFLIEDCAQAHGAKYNDKLVGTFGQIGCFSFHPSKNLPAIGDAGACITNIKELAESMFIFRHLGQKTQNEHVSLGMNSRLDTIQAIILKRRLAKLNDWNKKRLEIANRYIFEFQNLPFTFQVIPSHSEHVYHLFQIKTAQRDQLLHYLISKGIDAVIRYPYPIHLQESFAYLNYQIEDFPVAESLAKNLLCLPLHPYLTEKQFLWVVSCVKDFFL